MSDELNREVREITSPKAWHDWRTRDFPSSVTGALFEVHPFVKLPDVVARMQGRQERRPPTRSQRRGIIMQDCFPAAIREEHPDWQITSATTYHRLPKLRLGSTPDFWLKRPAGPEVEDLETKTMNERTWNDECHGSPPLYWQLQVQGQLLCTGLKRAVIAVMIPSPDLPLYLFDVEAHPAAQQKILAGVADFWKRFDAGEFPVAAPSEEIAEMLDDGSHVDLSADNYLPEALAEREALQATLRSAEKQKEQIDAEIKLRLGAASTGWLPGWQLSWKSHHYNEYTVPAADRRRLTITRTKEMGDDDR